MGNDDEVKGESTPPERGRRTPPRRTPKRQQPATAASESTNTDAQALVVRSRALFLRDVQHQLARRELYNLDEEFAKTRKNRSPVVLLSVSAFVVVMVAAGIIVTTYIQRRSQNVPVNIAAFQDVNLMSLLDRAKQLNDQLNSADQELSGLKTAQANEIQAAQMSASQQIQLVDNMMIGNAEKQRRIAAIRGNLAGRIGGIDASYAPKIKAAEAAIASINTKLAQYDTTQMQQAKKQEAILNNQQHLFDMQMQKTVSYYQGEIKNLNAQYTSEIDSIKQHNTQLVALLNHNHAVEIADLIAKYNPTFTEPAILSILNQPIPKDPASPGAADRFAELAVQSGGLSPAAIGDLQARLSDFSLLLGRLQEIPYQNSIPAALSHLAFLNEQIVSSYRQIGSSLAAVITAQEQRISRQDKTIREYDHALSSLIRQNRENGYVLDAQNPQDIAVFVDPLYHVQNGDLGYVFRQDTQAIGIIRFVVSGNEVSARLVSLTKSDNPMQPFDKILLNLK